MRRKRQLLAISFCLIIIIIGSYGENKLVKNNFNTTKQYEEACNTPLGKYPETITYTLGKMTGVNNSNMPAGDTYENNAYTRLNQILKQ